MKFCFNCGRITAGEPAFCSFCGRTYDVKLCSRMHPNPRRAMVCSKCGSRDFSTPQPKVPYWAPVLQFALQVIPGAILVIASAFVVLAGIGMIVANPGALDGILARLLALAVLWWSWTQLPAWFRKAIYDLLRRRRDREDRRRD